MKKLTFLLVTTLPFVFGFSTYDVESKQQQMKTDNALIEAYLHTDTISCGYIVAYQDMTYINPSSDTTIDKLVVSTKNCMIDMQ